MMCEFTGEEIINQARHAWCNGDFLEYLATEMSGYSHLDPYLDGISRDYDYFDLKTREEKIDYIIDMADCIIEQDELRQDSISQKGAERVYLCLEEPFRSQKFYKLLDGLRG